MSINILSSCGIHQYLDGAKNVVTTSGEGWFFDALIKCINAMPIQHWSPLLPYISLAFIYLFIYSYSYFFGGLCTYPSNGAPTLSDANKSSKNSIHTRLGITPSHISSRTYMPHGMMEVVLYNFTYLFPLNLGVNNQSAIQCIWSSSTNSWLHAPPGSSSKLKATVEFAPSPLV